MREKSFTDIAQLSSSRPVLTPKLRKAETEQREKLEDLRQTVQTLLTETKIRLGFYFTRIKLYKLDPINGKSNIFPYLLLIRLLLFPIYRILLLFSRVAYMCMSQKL